MGSRFKITCLFRLGSDSHKHQLIDLQNAHKVTFGRGDMNNIILDESKGVSRQHMLLEQDMSSKDWLITDLNSGNGVHVNRERIAPGVPIVLADRDIIEIGRDPCNVTTYVFQFYTKASIQVKPRIQAENASESTPVSSPPVVHLAANESSLKLQEMEDALKKMQEEALSATKLISELQQNIESDAEDKKKLEQEKLEQENKLKLAQEDILTKEQAIKAAKQGYFKELHKQETRFHDEKLQLQNEMAEVLKSKTVELEEMLEKLRVDEGEKIRALEQKNTEMCVNFEELMESELVCAICSELFLQATSLNCSHSFCKYCIDKWMQTKKECPQCRSKITSHVRSIVLDNYIDRALEQTSPEARQTREALQKEREKEQKILDAKVKSSLSSSVSASSSASSNSRPLLQGSDQTNRRYHVPGHARHNQQRMSTPEREELRRMYMPQHSQNRHQQQSYTHHSQQPHYQHQHNQNRHRNPFQSHGYSNHYHYNQAGHW